MTRPVWRQQDWGYLLVVGMFELLYLVLSIVFILICFAVFKRPMYEVIFVSFILVALISGHITDLPKYFVTVSQNYLLYAIIAFVAFSAVMDKTGVINDFLDIVISIVGRFSGGSGYVTVVASSIMGALSGSAPGNAASIGSIMIPSMVKTGYPPELAAVVSASSSSLGPMIPPSGAIITVFGMLIALFPGCCTLSQFWIVAWGVSLWLILQRVVMTFIYVRKYKIGPIPVDQRPRVRDALKKGWKTIFLPIIILIPFVLDSALSDFYVSRLGEEGASVLSGSLLVVVPSVAAVYTLLISREKRELAKRPFAMFSGAVKQTAPVAVMVFAGFALGELFSDIGVGDAFQVLTSQAGIPKWFAVIIIPLIWAVLGMFLEPLSILIMIGESMIALAATVGINPIMFAAVAIAMGHTMANMTPPFATTFFVSLGIAHADFVKTTKLMVVWCVVQYLIIVLMLGGVLPILGLMPFAG